MRVVIAVFIFTLIASAASLRVFFFSRESDGGAAFRLQCVGTPADNRCSTEQFTSMGKSMCSGEDLVLSSLETFGCVRDIDTKKELCKYANGKCAQPAGRDTVKDRPALDEENPPVEDLKSVESLPAVEEFPELPEPGAQVQPLPEAQDLPGVQTLPEAGPSFRSLPGLPERNTGLPNRKSLPQTNQ